LRRKEKLKERIANHNFPSLQKKKKGKKTQTKKLEPLTRAGPVFGEVCAFDAV
jgi:hypothetical protein